MLAGTPCTRRPPPPARGLRGRRGGSADRRVRAFTPGARHFGVEVVHSGDLPLANFPHYGQALFLAESVQCLSAFCASLASPAWCSPGGTLPMTHMAIHWSVTPAAWSRRWPASAKSQLTERTSSLRSSSWQPARGRVASVSRRAEAFAAGPRHPGELVEIPQ